jgi:DNA-binding transcriptional ArsR family regulator
MTNNDLMAVIYSRAGMTNGGSDNRVEIWMDSLITAAARALAAGDPLGALNRVALRDDAPALALRGIAMAQLGDFERAKVLLRSASRAFGSKEPVARARCIVAEAEVAFAARELGWSETRLDAARATLEARGDKVNAAHARHLDIRRRLLIGQIEEAETRLAEIDPAPMPPALKTTHHLIVADIAMRRLQTKAARAALGQAERAAQQAGIAALSAEVASAFDLLNLPAARLIANGSERPLLLQEVEALLKSKAFVVDACRHVVRQENEAVSLATRPVLFTLVRALAEAWPEDASRDDLVARAFRAKHADESHRARLRVEIGRLRRMLRSLAEVNATPRGFALAPHRASELVVLAWPVEERHADVLALLADGESWSSSALAIALDTSQRSVQRALDSLAAAGKVRAFGRGRARRWTMTLMPRFTTILLLPASLPVD